MGALTRNQLRFSCWTAALTASLAMAVPMTRSPYLDQVGSSLSLHPRMLFQAVRGGDGRESREAKVRLVGFAEKAGLESVRRHEARFEKELRISCARNKGTESECLEGLDRRKKDIARLEELFGKPMQGDAVTTRLYVSAVIYLHVAMESVLDPALDKTRVACAGENGKSRDCRMRIHQITKTAALLDDISRLAASKAGILPGDSVNPKELEGSIERRLAAK